MAKNEVLSRITKRNPNQPEFIQSVEEVYDSVKPVLDKHSIYRDLKIFERMTEPERLISFRVNWVDDNNEIQVNRGYRVQMNSSLGPFKGGLRFHPSVNYSILKFLAFEQTFKNALTGMPLGSGKGGSDFNPKGKSKDEIMRFCQAFMNELFRHLGQFTDIPAGDIGVGGREIGYLFGQYKKLQNEFTGVITGKNVKWGGSWVRIEATGFGLIYFACNMLGEKNDSLKGKRCLVSGAGNVAQHAIEKIIEMGGTPVTASDSSGFIYDEEGIDEKKLKVIMDIKNKRRGRIKEYIDEFPNAEYHETSKNDDYNELWNIPADCAFPCATQNEINDKDVKNLIDNKIQLIAEGANMPVTSEGQELLRGSGVMYAPGKASNAGGVAVSSIEMTQNRMGESWTREKVNKQLMKIMNTIHKDCLEAAKEYNIKDSIYLDGANIAGFIRVGDAMVEQGIV
ncbi:NADP-specific glutamate dehydrogenase [Marinigracilibium pacificum]|uniref:Glutamate dehydrogenase n=1 Tax=Marinigracilibium pacificum TaxID=2729599 RepID=A0A848J0T5_9BACT|nr:NADP-specific glutamate dehydrogenase [Marinigracilibium pacificum]NMM50403.1 NADP-specific glutamate dehydrogenase [Marinigracilibium pacificum]